MAGLTITYGDSTLTTLSSDTTIKLSTKHKWMDKDVNFALVLPASYDGSYIVVKRLKTSDSKGFSTSDGKEFYVR